jgi:hypothetical protein
MILVIPQTTSPNQAAGQVTDSSAAKFDAEYGSALPWIKDHKTIGVTDEDAPEECSGQQSILLGG